MVVGGEVSGWTAWGQPGKFQAAISNTDTWSNYDGCPKRKYFLTLRDGTEGRGYGAGGGTNQRVDYVLCPLSSVLCPLSSVLCPLSSVFIHLPPVWSPRLGGVCDWALDGDVHNIQQTWCSLGWSAKKKTLSLCECLIHSFMIFLQKL